MNNLAKARLEHGETIIGTNVPFGAPSLVELLGYAGLHWVLIDCEHGPMSEDEVLHMVRAAEVAGITPIVRPPANVDYLVARYLDLGAQGVLIPHVESKQDAEAAVRAARFPPLGRRGLGRTRWARYGAGGADRDLIARANAGVMVIALIESQAGIERLPEMLEVEGIDVVHIGPGDLSLELGAPGDWENPALVAAIERIIDTAVAAGRVVGCEARNLDHARQLQARGVRSIGMNWRSLVFAGVRQYLEALGGAR